MSGTRPPHVPSDEEKLARAGLTYLAEPGDPALGALLAICSPAEVLAAIQATLYHGQRARRGRPGTAQLGSGDLAVQAPGGAA